MKTNFEIIDAIALDTVHGGQDAEKAKGNVGVTVPTGKGDVQVGIQGEFDRSNYAKCLDTVSAMGGKPADVRAQCGLPSGQP